MASEDVTRNGAGRSGSQNAEWVPLKEAAEDAGISVSTLRNWYRKGEIDSRLGSGPHGKRRLVRKAEILERTSEKSHRRPSTQDVPSSANGHPSADLDPSTPSLPDLIKELGHAQERAARAESKADSLREQLAKVEARLASLLEENELEEAVPAEDLDDGLPEDFPREEDDEYLPLVQRWRARRKRRRILSRSAKRTQIPSS